MSAGPRTDKSVIGRWWRSVDRWTLGSILLLAVFGLVLVTAASPSVAMRTGLAPFHFVYKHLLFLPMAMGIMFVMSIAGRKTLWRLSSLTLMGSLVLILFTLVFGAEIKGATRWIHVFGFSLQPSEFIKPAFAVVSAWLMTRYFEQKNFPGWQITVGIFLLSMVLLWLQPDFGMSFVLACIWGAQILLSGLPLLWIGVLGLGGIAMVAGAYTMMPHVASRINRFLDPASGDNYQVQKSLDAFGNGGLFGTGPAHGQVKLNLPDAHADFIFAVAGEELGLLATLLLVGVFCFILLRSYVRIRGSDDLFIVLATGGLLTQFAVQSIIHMGSSLQLLPAKGMTLPFISYGGSSLLSLGFGMGMLLALTRKRTQTTPTRNWKTKAQYA